MRNTTFIAEITAINHNDMDEITIYKDGEIFDQIQVESDEGVATYNAAVAEAIGGADFAWMESIF